MCRTVPHVTHCLSIQSTMMSDYPVVILGISSSQYITQTSNYAHVRSSRYLQKLVMSAEHSPSHVRSLTQENGAPLTVSAHYADKNIVNIREPWPGLSDGSLSWEKPAPPGPSSRPIDTPFAQFTPMAGGSWIAIYTTYMQLNVVLDQHAMCCCYYVWMSHYLAFFSWIWLSFITEIH